MKLSIVTDEISQDPLEAIAEGLRMGVYAYELRVIQGKRLPDGIAEALPQLQRLQAEHGIRYSALSPGLFKCLPTPELMEDHLNNRLEASIRAAQTLGIPALICFAGIDHKIYRPDELRKAALPWLRRAALRAEEAGIRLAVETEFMSGCETGQQAADLVREIGSEGLCINWDVANAWIAGEDPLEGYRHVRGHIANIHVKDADTREWQLRNPFVVLGDGQLPWPELLQLLMADYCPDGEALADGAPFLTVETHIEPLVDNTRLFVERLQHLLKTCRNTMLTPKEEEPQCTNSCTPVRQP